MQILQNFTAKSRPADSFGARMGYFEKLLIRACVELGAFRGARIVNKRPDDPVCGGSGGDIR